MMHCILFTMIQDIMCVGVKNTELTSISTPTTKTWNHMLDKVSLLLPKSDLNAESQGIFRFQREGINYAQRRI